MALYVTMIFFRWDLKAPFIKSSVYEFKQKIIPIVISTISCFLTFSHSKLHTVADREKIISASVVGNNAVCKNLHCVDNVLIVNAKLWNIYFSTVTLVVQIPDSQSRYTVDLKLNFRTALDGLLLKNLEGQIII